MCGFSDTQSFIGTSGKLLGNFSAKKTNHELIHVKGNKLPDEEPINFSIFFRPF